MLYKPSQTFRNVAFFHCNTSTPRKEEILQDLKLPHFSSDKKLQCVIATISLGTDYYKKPFSYNLLSGVGVDIRVENTVVIGLSENMENLLQEGGRSMRGSVHETSGRRGFSFFLHKGKLGKY